MLFYGGDYNLENETFIAEWSDGAVSPVTSATVSLYVYIASVKYYLQSNGTSMSTTPYAFPMTNNGLEWSKTISPPKVFVGYNMTWEAVSNVSDLLPCVGEHYVGPVPSFNPISYALGHGF